VSIRFKVTLATVVIAALAVGAADVTTFVLLRDYFNRRADASVHQIARTTVETLRSGEQLTLQTFAGADRLVLVEVLSPQGKVLQRLGTSEAKDVRFPPDLASHPGHARVIEVPNRRGPAFDVIAVPAPAQGETVLAAVSLKNEISTLAHLAKLNFIVWGIVLALLAGVALVVLTRSLRPLRQIASTADAIAGGDLAARIPPAPKRSEIGRVATALNRMLAENEAAFAQRDATEGRLRRFLADASHELRTPLAVIRGLGEAALGETRTPAEYKEVMGSMLEEVDRLTNLVETLLRLSHGDAGTVRLARSAVDVGQLARDVASSLGILAEERNQRVTVDAADGVVVTADRLVLREAITNVVDNAIKYSPPASAIRIRVYADGAQAHLTVTDEGPGISAQDRTRIFDRFFRLDEGRSRDRGGAGLGLAIAKWAVEVNGGNISVATGATGGSEFRIVLPIPAPSTARNSDHATQFMGEHV
jgi:signal transduction histidine kinase